MIEKRGKQKKSGKQMLRDYIIITVASVIYAVAISLFLDPNSLAPGGVTGIAIILNRIMQIETGTLILVLNIPILLLGAWKFGGGFILSTLYCTAISSVLTNIMAPLGAATEDPLLATLAGACLMALSIGLILKVGATT